MASGKKYLVVSHGGVGTHAVSHFIRPRCQLGFNPVRHHIRPFALPFVSRDYGRNRDVAPVKMAEGDDVRVIYVFGNPMDACCSFFRRRAKDNAWLRLAVANLHGNYKKVGPRLTLQKFLDRGEDLFGFRAHVRAWTGEAAGNAPYPILAVRYETMYDHLDEIAEFVGLQDKVDQFTPFKKRHCDWLDKPKPIRDGLLKMYGGLAKEETKLGDCWRVN